MEREQAQKEFANGGTSINAKMRQLLEQNDDAFMTHLREYKSSDGMVTQDSEGTSSSGITEARDNATEGANNPKLRRGENPRFALLKYYTIH